MLGDGSTGELSEMWRACVATLVLGTCLALNACAKQQAIASVESQLASVDRLKQLSASTADRMRLTNSRLDELCARATEVVIGSTGTDQLASDVDDLVLELEGLHQAVQELPG